MTTDQLQAVAIKDGIPHLELSAQEIIYPIVIGKGLIYAHLKPYNKSKALIEVLRKSQPKFTTDGELMQITPGSDQKARDLFDERFIKLTGAYVDAERTEATLDQQKAWLSATPRLKEKIVAVSSGVRLEPEAEMPPENEQTQIEGVLIELNSELASLDVKSTVRRAYFNGSPLPQATEISLIHHMKRPSGSDWHAYTAAISAKELVRATGVWIDAINYEALEVIYDRLVEGIDGALWNGKACTEDNKRDWAPALDFWHKKRILDEVFKEIPVKNG